MLNLLGLRAVFAILFAGLVAAWTPVPADSPSLIIPAAQMPAVEAVVERFAPEVRFHPEERYFPSSVEWYLERTQVRSEANMAMGDLPTLMAKTQPSALKVAGARVVQKVEAELEETLGESALGRHFLKIKNDHPQREQAARRGELKSARTYVHLREPADKTAGLDIQYWFFYPYSGPVMAGPAGGAHEGDWEHITVRLDPSLERVEKIFFAAHDREGTWVSPEDVQYVEGTHPVVYSARYGHASYPSAGIQSRGMLPADRTSDAGERWQSWESLKIIADADGPREEIAWLGYEGRWGKTGVLFSGPRGPVFQRYWKSET